MNVIDYMVEQGDIPSAFFHSDDEMTMARKVILNRDKASAPWCNIPLIVTARINDARADMSLKALKAINMRQLWENGDELLVRFQLATSVPEMERASRFLSAKNGPPDMPEEQGHSSAEESDEIAPMQTDPPTSPKRMNSEMTEAEVSAKKRPQPHQVDEFESEWQAGEEAPGTADGTQLTTDGPP